MVPLTASLPVQAFEAVHAVALVDDQVSVALLPTVRLVGATLMVTVGAAALTVTLAELETDAPLAASPPYAAVMECAPMLRLLVLYTAIPVPFNVIDPNDVVPSLKVTVPVGTLEPPTSATVAVKLT
jgi:hypothetical protein